jgi:hypothetical protein
MRLIDADEVQKIIDHIRGKYVDTYNRRTKVNQFFWDTIRYIEKKVRSLPTIEVKPVVHGEWIFKNDGAYGKRRAYCSACGQRSGIGGIESNQRKPFCPNCGADMRKKV